MKSNLTCVSALPGWLPEAVRLYLDHTDQGIPLREIARREGRHASTILRTVRRFENRRDDPLMDEALSALTRSAPETARASTGPTRPGKKEDPKMSAPLRHSAPPADEATIRREGLRVLRRMAEPGAVLAIAADMEKAAVLREFPDGKSARTAVLDRAVAQAFLLKDWIACRKAGRIATYEMTHVGRAALRRMIEEEGAGPGLAEAPMVFAGQHRAWAEREVSEAGAPGASATTAPKARWRCWAGAAKRTASCFWRPSWSRQPSACARILRSPRWAPASRRTGSGS